MSFSGRLPEVSGVWDAECYGGEGEKVEKVLSHDMKVLSVTYT